MGKALNPINRVSVIILANGFKTKRQIEPVLAPVDLWGSGQSVTMLSDDRPEKFPDHPRRKKPRPPYRLKMKFRSVLAGDPAEFAADLVAHDFPAIQAGQKLFSADEHLGFGPFPKEIQQFIPGHQAAS